MKKTLFLLALLGLILSACCYKGHDYKVLGYCEEDGLYYFTVDGGIQSKDELPRIYRRYFEDKLWCLIPEPPEPEAKKLFRMQLLTKVNPPEGWRPYCIMIADGGISVEIQEKPYNCGWVADNHPCGGWVYSDDTWACDRYGYPRLPLHSDDGNDLWHVWKD